MLFFILYEAIVSCFWALLNPSSQIEFPVALIISHYLYTILVLECMQLLSFSMNKYIFITIYNSEFLKI